jgi:hypothetical protein
MRRALVLAVTGFVGFACCGGEKAPPVETGPLPPGVVARVGGTEISADLAARVARAQHVEPRAAAGSLADDALAARVALDRGLDRDPDVSWRLRALRARLVTDRLRDEAKAKGPLTDAEVQDLTRDHWQELDSPEQRTVIHAIVLKPASSADAAAVAEAVHAAVESATSPDDFESRAKAVPHGALKVQVERLPPFVADGRIAVAGAQGGLDTTFTAAAFAIPSIGKTSPIVETTFGWHVIRLLDVAPPRFVGLDQRRLLLGPEALARRAKTRHDAILDDLRAQNKVEISLSAEQSMHDVMRGTP